MTLRIHAPNPMRVGETANVLVTSDNPGVVSLTYGAGLTGPASVTIEGTRVWTRRINLGFNGGVGSGAATAARDGVTICWDFDMSQFCDDFQNYSSGVIPSIPIASNYSKGAATNLFNWEIIMQAVSRAFLALPRVQYLQTNAPPTASIAGFARALSVFSGLARFVMTLDNTVVTVYWHDGASKQSNTVARTAPTGNVDDPILAIYGSQRFAYFGSVLADDATGVDAWLAGDCPANPVVYYPCNEEVPDEITAAPYDASTNAYDGVFSRDATYPLTKAPRTFTDTVPVVPYAIVPVTAVATTGTTIDATRPRQGVPARASEAERIESADQVTVTVEAPLVSIGPDTDATVEAYPADVHLQVCATPDGIVSLASDDPNLAVDATVEIVGGSATVTCTASADVTGATVTATYGDTTDTASVTVTEAAAPTTAIKIGPSQTVRRGSTSISVHITGEDGEVTLSSTPHGLDCPATATISSGEVDVSIPIMSAGTYTITATDDTGSDTAVVVVPGNYQATEDYDLVQDIADVIEDMIPAAGNAYHYDEIVIDDDGRLDAEDHVFGVRIVGTIEGPIVGGKTIIVEVAVASFPQVSPADVESLQNYISQEADWPAYVGAVVCNQVQVNALNGGDIVIYQLEVILG